MDKISELLQYVHRTNPEMTRERLIEELSKTGIFSTISKISVFSQSVEVL